MTASRFILIEDHSQVEPALRLHTPGSVLCVTNAMPVLALEKAGAEFTDIDGLCPLEQFLNDLAHGRCQSGFRRW